MMRSLSHEITVPVGIVPSFLLDGVTTTACRLSKLEEMECLV